MVDSISGRHRVTRRGGLLAMAALLALAWLSACGSQQASSTASPAAASAAPTQTAASKVPGVAALTGLPANCAAGASDAAVSDGVGKPVKLASEQPVTDTLTCWYSVDGQSMGGVGPISLVYNVMSKVPTRADFDNLLAAFNAGRSGVSAPPLEEIPGLGDFGAWLVETIPGYGTIYQVAASKGTLLVAFGVTSTVAQGDKSRMTALVHALLG